MTIFPPFPIAEYVFLAFLSFFSIFLFFGAVMIIALLILQRRFRWLLPALPVTVLSYFLTQCYIMHGGNWVHGETATAVIYAFAAIPSLLRLMFCLILAGMEFWVLIDISRTEKSRITAMSVKEAMDSLPTGLLCYASGGRVLLVNRAMQDFCGKAVGEALINGESFCKRLFLGPLSQGCRLVSVGGEQVTVLQDGSAWKLDLQELLLEGHTVQMLLASEITEAYQKTAALQAMQERVERLNRHLVKVNREIVALTAEQEILNAKVAIHDELGSNLLAIKRFIHTGGTAQEKAELTERLSRTTAFLKNDRERPKRDEYELLIDTAKRLGLTVSVTGTLPEEEPLKHILATAIHECCTNTLRHAHGDELTIRLTEDAERIIAEFTNNGQQPTGEIVERGGLVSLRTLTEQAGGSMTLTVSPVLRIRLELPKEVGYAI